MGANLSVRSCRYMPPESYADFGEPRLSQFRAVGARSYCDISRRSSALASAVQRQRSSGPLRSLISFLSRFLG